MTLQTSTGEIYCLVILFFLSLKDNIPSFIFRAVFGYDGKTNDLKVVETGGEEVTDFTEISPFFSFLRQFFHLVSLEAG